MTLTHAETDVSPECTIVLGGGRLRDDDHVDDRRIEIAFEGCCFTRTAPHGDDEGIESLGYDVTPANVIPREEYLSWLATQWRATGICPVPGFYVAVQSPWLDGVPALYRTGCRHYVVWGRDGHVELIARSYRWREWRWSGGHREDAPTSGPVIGEGGGVE